MRRNEKGTYQDNRDKTCSVRRKAKQGNQWFPGTLRKLHYKRRGWVVKKAARKKERNTLERRDSLRKNYQKICAERKILRENKYCFPISCKSNYGTYSDPTRIKLRKF